MKVKISRLIILIFAICLFLQIGVYAEYDSFVPYNTYEYNTYKESVVAPVGYYPLLKLNSKDLGLELPIKNPTDIYYDNKSSIYLLDSGNARIIEFTEDLKVKNIVSKFIIPASLSPSGLEEIADITDSQGFTIGENREIYIADTINQRVLITDSKGVVFNIIDKSKVKSLAQDAKFDVSKVILGENKNIQVIAGSINNGIMVFQNDGTFIKFFGSNPVNATYYVIMKYLRRSFMSEGQLQRSMQYTPITISNFDMTEEGFVLTVNKMDAFTSNSGAIRKLNYKGLDILNANKPLTLGDSEWDGDIRTDNNTKFIDIDIDNEGFINILDSTKGRVFQYWPDEGKLISVFSSIGTQKGTLGKPVALESIGNKVCVVDQLNNEINIFAPTDYAINYREAMITFNNGDISKSLELFKKLVAENTNNEFSFYGMGKIYDTQGNYSEAMKYFKLANSHTDYSISYQQYRKEFVRQNLFVIILLAIGLIAVIWILVAFIKKLFLAKDKAYTIMESKYLMPFYAIVHPIDGFDQFKSRKIQSYLVSGILTVGWFFIIIMKYFMTGYIFNTVRAEDFSIFISVIQTFGLFFLFVLSNWAICTLIEGKGKISEIIAVTSYSLIPYLFSLIAYVILSNILTDTEGAFLGIVVGIGTLWTAMVLFCGLLTVHQYTVAKTVVSLVFTFIGMAIIIFLIILFYSLMSQSFSFIESLIQEINLRK